MKQDSGAGNGFKMGEKVTVIVDFHSGNITWKVEQEVRHSLQCDRLKNLNIKWVPYVSIC